MQSSHEASASASSREADYMDSIAQGTHSRKRTLSQMTDDVDEGSGPNFDIMKCFPRLLCEYAFQHLNAKELLEMSTVNRQWNTFVGERPQVRKLKLVFRGKYDNNYKKLTREDEENLMNSERKYENIEIRVLSDLRFPFSLLAKRAGSWKSVNIETSGTTAREMLPKILQIADPTVEELSIDDSWYDPEDPPNIATSFTFPRLKNLTCWYSGYSWFRYFGYVTTLVNFQCDMPATETEEASLELRTILRHNHNLKELRISGKLRFLEHLSGIKFKLQKLSIDRLEDDIPTFHHFHSFLKTQVETLESLVTVLPLDQELLEIILGMPRLTTIEISSISDEIQELPVNTTIASFKVKQGITAREGVRSRGRIAYQKLIKAMRSLKHFECNQIDAELLFLLQDFPELESITVEELFNVLRIPERNAFPNLKEFKAYGAFHEQMQEPTGDDNFAKLVRREMARTGSYRVASDSD